MQRIAELGEADALANGRCATVGEVRRPRIVPAQNVGRLGPLLGDDLRDGEPLGRVLDRRLERALEAQFAEFLDGQLPAASRSGDGYRQRAVLGHRRVVGIDVRVVGDPPANVVERRRRRCAPAASKRADLAVGGSIEREHVPAEAGRGRFDDV